MKVSCSLILTLIMVAAAVRVIPAQTVAQGAGSPSRSLSAAVERAAGKIYLHVTNTDGINTFRGSAQIRFDSAVSSTETPRLALELAPAETRLFPINAAASSSEQYMLTIYNQDGAVVLFQAAPVKEVSKVPVQPPRPAKPAAPKNEMSVQPMLVRASHYIDAEIPVPDGPDPLILVFEISTPAPINNANLAISAKDFRQRQAVTAHDLARVEFRLPDELSERNLQYVLTDASGKVMVKGEVDLDQMIAAELVTVSGLTFDRPAYAPGDSARLVIELQGQTSRSYRLELTAKEGDTLVYKDMRKGVGQTGQARQEFVLDLPLETTGALTLEYKVFSAQTGALFDSGVRMINLSDTGQKNNAGDKPRYSP